MDRLDRNDLEGGERAEPRPAALPAPLPTASGIPLRTDGFRVLTDALDYAAGGRTGCTFHDTRGRVEMVLGFARLRDDARRQARRLAALGLAPGDRVGLVAETSAAFLTAFLGCVAAGLIPVPLPVSAACPSREAHLRLIARLLAHCGAALLLGPGERLFADGKVPVPGLRELAWSDLAGEGQGEAGTGREPAPASPDDCCYIQYSSGSTSFPRGVAVTHRALLSNCRAITAALALRPDDRVATWLPLYHDMGLVGTVLAALTGQRSIDLMAPETFARRPPLWLGLMSRNRATISYAPCFGYDLGRSRSGPEPPPDLDLRSWRVAGVGGEMVSAEVMDAFAAHFAPAGFRRTAIVASYGLAESTLGVAFAPLGRGLRIDAVDRDALWTRGTAMPAAGGDARLLVRCGRPLDGQEVRIADAGGVPLPPRRIGRILVRGPSVMQGYFRDPAATAAVLDPEGWLDTGDLGYLCEGELVVVGRSKDTIIVNGRNVCPQDLEAVVVEALPGLRRQSCAAFGAPAPDGRDRVVVLVQCRAGDRGARQALAEEARRALRRATGLDCRVVPVPPRSLPRTTSGKLSRSAARALYLSGRFEAPDDLEPATLEPGRLP